APAPAQKEVVTFEGGDLGLPFSPAVWGGDVLYLSGALGNKPGTTEITGDAAAQTEQAIANLRAAAEAAGVDLDQAVSMDLYLTDRGDFKAVSEALAKAGLGGEIAPARATLETDLALREAKVEIGMVAVRKGVAVKAVTPMRWPTRPGFNWGVMAGDNLYIAGMLAYDPALNVFHHGDAGVQTRRALDNVGAVLKAAELTFQDVVRCRVFLADARDYTLMNEAYGQYFKDAPPARATVRAKLLPTHARVEIQCQAVRGGDRKVVRADGEKPSGRPFSPAVEAGGTLYVAGMVGRGADGYPAGVEAQTEVTLDRLEKSLKAAGLGFGDVVSATVYLTDIRHYGAMNEIYAKRVGTPAPARATVGTALMSPEALVEIQMTAVRPKAAEKN
ncbi:MAG: RidA family protein, partial [Acidobacteriota bacterium]